MKKLLLSLFTVLTCIASANATDVIFDFSKPADYGFAAPATGAAENLKVGDKLTSGVITIEVTSMGGTATRFWNSKGAIDFRAYSGATLKITSSGDPINKLDFGTSSGMSVDGNDITGKWTGSDASVIIGVSGSSITLKTLTVTIGVPETLCMPTFSIPSGVCIGAKTIKISCGTSGADIHYTTDGTTIPTAESPIYSSEISVSSDITFKAIAIKGTESSPISSVTYTFPVVVDNIANFLSKADKAVVAFNNPVTVVYQAKAKATDTYPKYLYVKDETGFMLIYGDLSQSYINGDIISKGFYGTKSSFNGLIEFTKPGYFDAGTASGSTVSPVEFKIADIKDADVNKYVIIKDVTCDFTAKTISDGTSTMPLYFAFGEITNPENGKYSVEGFISINTGKLQLYPTKYNAPTDLNEIKTTTDKENAVYDVLGRRVVTPVKGQLYIKSGKKYVK